MKDNIVQIKGLKNRSRITMTTKWDILKEKLIDIIKGCMKFSMLISRSQRQEHKYLIDLSVKKMGT